MTGPFPTFPSNPDIGDTFIDSNGGEWEYGTAGWFKTTIVLNSTYPIDPLESGGGVPPGGSTGQVLQKLSDADGDADWASVGGVGTVTSVDLAVPTGFTSSGGPITSGGTLTVGYAAGYQGYTSTEASKLSGITAGAEPNVNADWNASSGDAEILNKPSIPAPADATPQPPGVAAIGTSTDYAREDHVHDLPAVVSISSAGLRQATSFSTITYGASVALDFASLDAQYRTISLTGDLELTTSNLANGRTLVIRLVADGTQRTLTFPTDWKFLGTKPANIAASKTAVLSLTAFGTTNADVVAAYAVQS